MDRGGVNDCTIIDYIENGMPFTFVNELYPAPNPQPVGTWHVSFGGGGGYYALEHIACHYLFVSFVCCYISSDARGKVVGRTVWPTRYDLCDVQ